MNTVQGQLTSRNQPTSLYSGGQPSSVQAESARKPPAVPKEPKSGA